MTDPADNADELQAVSDAQRAAAVNAGTPDNPVEGAAFSATASGNAALTAFPLPHGAARGKIPTQVYLEPRNAASAATHWVSAVDATNVTVTFAAAPASGTNNLSFYGLVVFGD